MHLQGQGGGAVEFPLAFQFPFVILILALLLPALCLQRWFHVRGQRRRREIELSRLNNLHQLAMALSGTHDPAQMAADALNRTLEIVSLAVGYILLRAPGCDEPDCSRAAGLSATTLERLSRGSLPAYLASSADRWGSLMLFPDLPRPDLIAAWQRDADFREFQDVLLREGLRTLLVIGLKIQERSYGALVVGSRAVRAFDPGELRLMLAVGNQISVALENSFLHRAAERHNEELRILHRAAEELSATFDFEQQVRILRHELAGLLGATNFFLAFQDSAGGPLEVVAGFQHGASNGRPRVDELAEHVVRTGSPLLIARDFPQVARHLGVATELDIRTWAGVPVHFSDGATGVLAVADFEREDALDERQFELLQVLAGEVAAAIENARLFQREQRRARHLALLNELGRKATAMLSPHELLSGICGQIRSAFNYDLVRIATIVPQADELVVDAQEGYGAGIIGWRLRVGEDLAGAAAETGEPVLASSVMGDPRYIPVHPGVRSALNLPLRYRDVTLGVLSVESFRKNSFSQQDVVTLQTLADQLAIALHNARAYQVAREQAITDGLTALKTHRYFMEALEAEWQRSTRSGRPFSLIMMDLDGFKQVNDRYGHLEGDKVLMAVAQVLEARSRQSNVVARYGGDEFAILMSDATAQQAAAAAERMSQGVAADLYLADHRVTASCGVATYPEHGAAPEEILRIADSGVYLAKHEGGNCVRLASRLAKPADVAWDQHVLQAYLGVAVKRMFPTGPEAFDQYFARFQQVAEKSGSESVSVLDIVAALAYTIDAKDHYTRGHSQGVSRLAAQLAGRLGLGQAQVEEIRLAGIVHDIGKIGVPESILNKPGRLSIEEFEVMKSHAVLGDKILQPLRLGAIERIRRIVRHHHEFIDGKGYPDGLRGDKIPLGARILTIADAFDTMVSYRAYKKGRNLMETTTELRRCAGSQFDQMLVEAFIESLATSGDPRKPAALAKAAS